MSIEIKTKELSEIRALAESCLKKAEEEKDFSKREKHLADVDACIKAYTAESRAICYAKAKKSENPLIYAIKEYFFPSIKLDSKKDKDTDIVVLKIIDVEKPIDLLDMRKRLGDIVGNNPNWIYRAEKLNALLTMKAAEDLNCGINMESYQMNKISKDIDMGKTPLSNTNILKTLNGLILDMLGAEYKASSHDVAYLKKVYAQDDKRSKRGVITPNHKTFVTYLKKVCYNVITGEGYTVISKCIKDKD